MDFDLSPEQKAAQAKARRLADESIRPFAADVDLKERYPEEGLCALADSGFAGLTVPREFGGMDADATTSCLVAEEISRGCASTGALILTFSGTVKSLAAFGTQAQKDKYLPGMDTRYHGADQPTLL